MSDYYFFLGDEGVTTYDCGHKAKYITGEIYDYRGPMVYYNIHLHPDGRAGNIAICYNIDVFQNFKDHIIVVMHVDYTPAGRRKFIIIDPENRGKKGDRHIFGREEFKSFFSGSIKKVFWDMIDGIMLNEPRIKQQPANRGSRKMSCSICGKKDW